jgi:hypothetical protein
MFTLLRRLLVGPRRPETRMTDEEVRVLADEAAQKARIDSTLGLVSVRRVNGRIIWSASTTSRGSGWYVDIDDATGEVGPVRRWGIR